MPSILKNVDTFMACVPWDERRVVLVYRRTHGGREYIRLRTWNRHGTNGWWYPTRRFFVIPHRNAERLADALRLAFRREAEPKPEWLMAHEHAEASKIAEFKEMGEPEELVETAVRRMTQRQR